MKKKIQNNRILALYHNVWYLLEKLDNFFASVKQIEEKHNWIYSKISFTIFHIENASDRKKLNISYTNHMVY